MNTAKHPSRIGELLVHKGIITLDQLRIALIEQKKRREPLGKILVRLGFATEAIIRDVMGGALGQESVDLSKVVVDSEVVKLIPKEMARRHRLLPLTYDIARHRLTLAMADTFNVVAIDHLNALLGGMSRSPPSWRVRPRSKRPSINFTGSSCLWTGSSRRWRPVRSTTLAWKPTARGTASLW